MLLPKFQNPELNLLGNTNSLHAFIENIHKAEGLRFITAWASVIAFTGLAAFEIIWGAKIISVLFDENLTIYYFSVFILGLYMIAFLWQGGLRAAINSDQIQLVFIYIGIHFLVAWSISQPQIDFSQDPIRIVAYLIVIASILMFVMRVKLLLNSETIL